MGGWGGHTCDAISGRQNRSSETPYPIPFNVGRLKIKGGGGVGGGLGGGGGVGGLL